MIAEGGEDGARADDELLAAAAGGERDAFRRIVERNGPRMLALAQRVTGNANDADEIVQEAFLKIWKAAPQWRADGHAQLSTWLYRVVLNAAIDRLRRPSPASLDEVDEVADCSAGGFERVIEGERRRFVSQALQELPERQRTALILCYFAEVTGEEAAQVLAVTRSALDALLVRGRRALRQKLLERGITGFGDIE